MFRYFALAWTVGKAAHEHAARMIADRLLSQQVGWSEAFAAGGLRIFCVNDSEANECNLLRRQGGVVLGTAFEKNQSSNRLVSRRSSNFDEPVSERIVQSRGRCLIDSSWGSYVAFIHCEEQRRTWILRSPLGSLPCLTTQCNGVRLYFSFLPDCAALGVIRFSVNWNFIVGHLAKTKSADTGLDGLRELRGGVCIELGHDGGETRHTYWNPLDVARDGNIEDRNAAAAQVQATVRDCVHAWASQHDRILMRLSGGLDSSVVLSCLADAPSKPGVTSLIRFSSSSSCDERTFARLAAARAGCDLLELARDPNFPLQEILRVHVSERPQNYLTHLGISRAEDELARRRGLSAVFNGDYGDQLFFGAHSALAAADYIYHHGLRFAVFKVAWSAAQVEGCSIWEVLREALPKGLFQTRWSPARAFRRYHSLCSDSVLNERADAQEFPWFEAARYVPPGKQFQIYATTAAAGGCCSPFYESGDPQYITPLLSQPVAELCLKIATYVLTNSGWSREVQRQAFSADVPPEITWRRWKGGQDDYTFEVLRRNRSFIREMLLDGALVREGLLDRRKVEETFKERPAALIRETSRISHCLNTEVWLRLWTQSTLRAAA